MAARNSPPSRFVPWPSIEQMYQVSKAAKKYRSAERLVYRAKVKLHGTNSAVRVRPDGTLFGQSRKRTLSPDKDNAGFLVWVSKNEEFFKRLARDDCEVIVFGEWCGKGIQKGDAVCLVPEKQFAVFAIQYGDHQPEEGRRLEVSAARQLARESLADTADTLDKADKNSSGAGGEAVGPPTWGVLDDAGDGVLLDVEPERILAALGDLPETVHVIPWHTAGAGVPCEIDLQFANDVAMRVACAYINRLVGPMEREDPWIKATFGLVGPGEGLVWYPVTSFRRSCSDEAWTETPEVGLVDRAGGPIPRHTCAKHMFKTKTAHHSGASDEAAAQMKPTVAKNAADFAELLLTGARCKQGVSEVSVDGFTDRVCYVEWCLADVQKEGADHLEAAGLGFADVRLALIQCAEAWYERTHVSGKAIY